MLSVSVADTRYIKMFVLDEADEMLSRGFKDQIYDVFKNLNENIQVSGLNPCPLQFGRPTRPVSESCQAQLGSYAVSRSSRESDACLLISGDPAVGHDAAGRARGDDSLHARTHPYPRQEGGADTGGYPPVLHRGGARGEHASAPFL